MSEITVRPMMPEDWTAVSKIYLEGIATEHALSSPTARPTPPGTHPIPGNAAWWCWTMGSWPAGQPWHRVDPRWCYRGVAEVSIYVGEKFRGKGLGYHLLTALCREAEQAGYWTLQSTVLQDNAPSPGLHEMWLPRGGPRERIARDATAAGWTPI